MEKVKPFVNDSRKKDLAFWLFPWALYKLLPNRIVNFHLKQQFRRAPPTRHAIRMRKLWIVVPLWFVWSKWNPWLTEYRTTKKNLLGDCAFYFGDRLRLETTILPLWWVESYVNYLVRRRYVRRWLGLEYTTKVDFVEMDVGTNFLVQEKAGDDEDDDDDDEDDDDDDEY